MRVRKSARDVDGAVLELGKQVEATSLLVADAALQQQPLQTRIVSVQLEGLIEIRTQRLERVHHGQKLQQVGRVQTLGESQLALLKGD